MTHRYRILCAFTVLGCTPGTSRLPAPSSAEHDGHAASALSAALADTVSATRVYLPSEVAMPATVVSETEGQQAMPRSIVGPSEVLAGIRGVIDAGGAVEFGALEVLPGSDPREAAILVREAKSTRWRPARLADGRAVRQLFEWRICRSGGSTCAHYVAPPVVRAMSRVDAP
jgi:hypothetical protein